MRYTDPSITLLFLGGELASGHSNVQTVGSADIVYPGIQLKYQLLDGLKSSSNQVSLQLLRTCSAVEDLISTDGDVKAILMDESDIIFTGYISTNFSWSVTGSGMKALNITIEDVGTRLLGKAYSTTGSTLFECTADRAIREICRRAGITVSSECSVITSRIVKVIEEGTTCRDILSQMLYELGYVYYFDNLGNLRVFRIDCTSISGAALVDGSKLYASGGKAISLSKSLRQYRSARMTYTTIAKVTDFLVYRNTTGQDDAHRYCNMAIGAGEYFDGTEVYTDAEWQEETEDSFRVPARIEACNAESRTDVVGSSKIISVSDVSMMLESDGNVTGTVSAHGGPYLEILVHNSDAEQHSISRMDVKGTIHYEKETGIVRTAVGTAVSESSDNILEETLEYVHENSLVQIHANLVAQYHRYCSSRYGFLSKEDLGMGDIVHLRDDVFSGLDVYVLVYAKSLDDRSDLIQYSAIGISVFDLDADVYHTKEAPGTPTGVRGRDGASYTISITSSNGSTFRMESVSTVLTCHVFENTEEITDSLDDSAFSWKRMTGNTTEDEQWNTSSKAIAHRSVEIGPDDCLGRTVFSCEVDLSAYRS